MHNDNRQIKRVHLIYDLRIFDTDSKKTLGHLVDISTRGMMMISEKPVPSDRDFSLGIELPATIADSEEITFSARCLWCKKDFNPDFYLSGFQIEELNPEEVKIITALINSYGFKRF